VLELAGWNWVEPFQTLPRSLGGVIEMLRELVKM